MRRPVEEHEDHTATERWTVSYADFMTLLFALFVTLFASSRHGSRDIQKVSSAVHAGFQELQAGAYTDAAKTVALQGGTPPGITRSGGIDVVALQRDLTQVLGAEIARSEVVLRMTPDGFVISLRELGFFRSGEAVMLAGAENKVRRLGEVLTRYGLHVRVEGHTDSVPIHTAQFQSNWDLSVARATSVAMMLLDEGRFAPERMSIAGYGQYHPVADNSTVDGRRANRRVDVVIVTSAVAARGSQ